MTSDIKKTTMETILDEIKKTAKMVQNNKRGIDMMTESCEGILQRVEYLGKKFDEILLLNGSLNVSKPSSKTKKQPKSTDCKEENKYNEDGVLKIAFIANIMAYFKYRYVENEDKFLDIVKKEQVEEVEEDNKKKLDKLSDKDKKKKMASLIYKSLSETQKDRVREMMKKEKKESSMD